MAQPSPFDRLERFLSRHEGSGGAAIIGLLVILMVVGAFAALNY